MYRRPPSPRVRRIAARSIGASSLMIICGICSTDRACVSGQSPSRSTRPIRHHRQIRKVRCSAPRPFGKGPCAMMPRPANCQVGSAARVVRPAAAAIPKASAEQPRQHRELPPPTCVKVRCVWEMWHNGTTHPVPDSAPRPGHAMTCNHLRQSHPSYV